MSRVQQKRAAKLSDTDKKVLNVYAGMSMETGKKDTEADTQQKNATHKATILKL